MPFVLQVNIIKYHSIFSNSQSIFCVKTVLMTLYLRIFKLFQRASGDSWTYSAVELLDRARVQLQEALDIATGVLQDTAAAVNVGPIVWEEIQERLETILRSTGESLDRQTVREPQPTSPPQRLECKICTDALPDTALHPCFHTVCSSCAVRLYRCPFCRETVTERYKLMF